MLEHRFAARLTQIDYDREMALVLIDDSATSDNTDAEIYAVVRLYADPDRRRAEFAIIVSRHLAGQGAGTLLMQRLIAYARAQGIAELVGSVLRENTPMLGLAKKLGFTIAADADRAEPGTVVVKLDL